MIDALAKQFTETLSVDIGFVYNRGQLVSLKAIVVQNIFPMESAVPAKKRKLCPLKVQNHQPERRMREIRQSGSEEEAAMSGPYPNH